MTESPLPGKSKSDLETTSNEAQGKVTLSSNSDLAPRGLMRLMSVEAGLRNLPKTTMPATDKEGQRALVMAQFRINAAHQKQSQPRPTRHHFLRTVAAIALILLFIIGGTGSVVKASEATVPGEFLYGVKRLAEKVELFFSSAEGWPDLLYQFAQARLNEIDTLTARGQAISSEVLSDATLAVAHALEKPANASRRDRLLTKASMVLSVAVQDGGLSTERMNRAIDSMRAVSPTAPPNPTFIPTVAHTLTSTFTVTPTATVTLTPTLTVTLTVTETPTLTVTLTATETPTDSKGKKPTPKPTKDRPDPVVPSPNPGNKGGNNNGNPGNGNPRNNNN